MTPVHCEWYLLLCEPLMPTLYWNCLRREWVDDRADASRYGPSKKSVNYALGQRRRHGPEHQRQHLDVAYLSVPTKRN